MFVDVLRYSLSVIDCWSDLGIGTAAKENSFDDLGVTKILNDYFSFAFNLNGNSIH